MKKLLLTPLLTLLSLAAFSQYQTPGTGMKYTLTDLVNNSAGSITYSNNTYFFNDSVTIAQTDTLEIVTNEVIKLDDAILFTISGTLIVNPTDSVVFTAINPATRFHSFKFEEFSDGSMLRKAIIEYGNGIKLVNSDMLFDSCTISNHGRSMSNNSGAISISNSNPQILNCHFSGNVRSAISGPANGGNSPIIRNNTFVSNATENGNYPQINLGPAGSDPIIIEGNTVIGDTLSRNSGGIGVSNLLGGTNITHVQINGNTIQNNRYGITLTGGNIQAYIKDNLIEDNNINPNAMTGGSGINFYNTSPTQQAIVARNIIRGNLWGVTLQSGAVVQRGPQVSLGRVNRTDTADVGGNFIYANGNGGQVYDVYNNTSDTVWAQLNNWNTTDSAVIESHIFHVADDSVHGPVYFMPLTLPTAVKETVQAISLAVYPNPATDFITVNVADFPKGNLLFFDQVGKQVLNVSVKSGSQKVNVSMLPAGVYFYKLNNGASIGKLVVVR